MNPKKISFTAVYVDVPEGGYAAYVEEIPGVNSQGETLDEARKNLQEALLLVLDTNKILSRKQFGKSVKRLREPLAFA
jgi:predicted RNase H-like HicB family nuclease